MNYQIAAAIRRFFAQATACPKRRSELMDDLRARCVLSRDEAAAVIAELVGLGFLYQSTERYARGPDGAVHRDAAIGLGDQGSDILQVAGPVRSR